MDITISITLVVFSLLAISLKRTYGSVSAKELKKRARKGDNFAKQLYKAVGFGQSLSFLLWLLIGISSALFFVQISSSAPIGVALGANGLLIWFGFFWIPTRQANIVGRNVAHILAPLLGRLLNYIHPLINWLLSFLRHHWPVHVHTGLYDVEDLLELLKQQSSQPDNRVNKTELNVAKHALMFGEFIVRDVMVPRKVVQLVDAKEMISPVTLSEFHDSGYSRYPVFENEKSNIIGTLLLRDVVNKKGGGTVKKAMRPDVFYLHEEQSLREALQAILKTKHHLFIVVNDFEEFVGIITMEDVLEKLVGLPIVDEFDQYDNMRLVAAKIAAEEHKEHLKKSSTAESSEVVE